MPNILSKLTCLFLISLGLSSCDCTYDYAYEVENQTNGEIKVYYGGAVDSTSVAIQSNGSEVLFITDHGTEACKDGPFYADVVEDLQFIEVVKEDSLNSTKNYLFNGSWTYINGTYTARVTEEEF